MRQDPIIEIRHLTTQIGEQVIHQDLNLDIYRNEIMAIVGGSGSGKTTLLRAILMLQSAQGSIKIFGKEILSDKGEDILKTRNLWGVMFQHSALFSSLTVLENLMFPLKEHTQLDNASMVEIAKLKLSLVGLNLDAANKFPAELSGGMQKRVALARAIVLDPALLFLDEPTTGLDPKGASGLDELVLQLKNALGLTIIFVTHDLDSMWRVADKVAFLGNKKVLKVGTMDELFQSDEPIIHEYFNDPRSKIVRRLEEV